MPRRAKTHLNALCTRGCDASAFPIEYGEQQRRCAIDRWVVSGVVGRGWCSPSCGEALRCAANTAAARLRTENDDAVCLATTRCRTGRRPEKLTRAWEPCSADPAIVPVEVFTSTFAADLKPAFRNLRRGGWLSVTVVLMLAVAIGAVTAIFSIAHAVLIKPLPVAAFGRSR